jgi:hypothetical protein
MIKHAKPRLRGIHRAMAVFDNSAPQLAAATGFSRQNVYAWIKQGFIPSPDACCKVFHVTRVPVTELNPHARWDLILNGAHPPVAIPPMAPVPIPKPVRTVFKRATGEVVPDQRRRAG